MDRGESCVRGSSWRTSGKVAWGDSGRCRKQKGEEVDRVEELRIAWAVAWHGLGRRESGGWPPSGCGAKRRDEGEEELGGRRERDRSRRPGAGAGEKVKSVQALALTPLIR